MLRSMFKPSVEERALAQAVVRGMYSQRRSSRLRVITYLALAIPAKTGNFFLFLSSSRKRFFTRKLKNPPQQGQDVLMPGFKSYGAQQRSLDRNRCQMA